MHAQPSDSPGAQIYTLEVFILSGPISEEFVDANPMISRTIQIRGDQTLADLHMAIFRAFDRTERHMYEFQFGKGPRDPNGDRYVLDAEQEEGPTVAGEVASVTIDSLQLQLGRAFGYWFDFRDNWWHQINIDAVEPAAAGEFPRVIQRTGASPPQHPDWDAGEESPEADPHA